MRHLHTSITTGASVDLHVLSTPPTFVLSQDQTLRSKFILILWSLIFFRPKKSKQAYFHLGLDETQEEITHTNLYVCVLKLLKERNYT